MNNTHPIFQDIFKQFGMTEKKESHQEFTERLKAIRRKSQIHYRGYIIEPTSNGCPYGGYDYYPASEGRNDDADCAGDPAEYHYTGNVGFASSIDNAKDAIMERIMEQLPSHKVELNGRIYDFPWIEDAIKFAVLWNGNLHPIVNP